MRIAVIGLCVVVLVSGLTVGDLYRNEGLRARLAAEALAGGGWLVPTLHGEPHLTKPPGMSVLIALCSAPVGAVTPWTARLPSVLAGAVAIVVVGAMVGRSCGRRAGWLAAAILPCSPLWLDRVPSAEIDLVQLCWVTLSMGCFLRAIDPFPFTVSRIPRADLLLPVTWWLLTFLCITAGFFTKWTAPAFFYLTALPFLWWRNQLRLLLSPGHLLGLLLFLVLASTWLFLVADSVGWAVLREAVEREALLRLSPTHHPRPYPWDELLTFPIGFLAGCLPWTLFAVWGLRPAFRRDLDDRQRMLWQLATCWLVTSLVFWTLVPGHRPRHVLPAQPAVALLAALVLVRERHCFGVRRFLAALSFFSFFTFRREEQEKSAARNRRTPESTLLASWLAVKLVFVLVVIPARQATNSSRPGGETLARLVSPNEILHLRDLKDDGLVFYSRRATRRLRDWEQLPHRAWCLLTDAEWRSWRGPPLDVETTLRDGQGAPLVLARRMAN